MCVSQCMCVSMCVWCVCVCGCLWVCVSHSASVSLCFSLCVYFCVYVCLSLCVAMCVSVCVCVCLAGMHWEGLGAGGEGDDRGWDGWMVSQTRWTWVWVNSGSWWWTGRPGVLRDSWGRKESDTTEWLHWTEHGNDDDLGFCACCAH